MRPWTNEVAGQVDTFVESYRDYYKVPGVSLALIQDGKVVYAKSYGVENSLTQTPLREEAVFEAASITKAVFAYVMNRLVQRGEFDLDQPLHELVPFPELEKYPEYKLMTARHVLTHVSGLPNWGAELLHTPGTTYGYSGEGFEYLNNGDFRCMFEVYDDLKTGYIIFTNADTGGPLVFDIARFLVEGK